MRPRPRSHRIRVGPMAVGCISGECTGSPREGARRSPVLGQQAPRHRLPHPNALEEKFYWCSVTPTSKVRWPRQVPRPSAFTVEFKPCPLTLELRARFELRLFGRFRRDDIRPCPLLAAGVDRAKHGDRRLHLTAVGTNCRTHTSLCEPRNAGADDGDWRHV